MNDDKKPKINMLDEVKLKRYHPSTREFIHPETIALTWVEGVTVSTVNLNDMARDVNGVSSFPYETCLFYEDTDKPSKVIGRYATPLIALNDHIDTVNRILDEDRKRRAALKIQMQYRLQKKREDDNE
jgi:hypothetical protein